MQEKIICPACGEETDNLLAHIKVHKEYKIYDKKTFYEYFPNYDGKFQLDRRIKKVCKCHICGKEYNYNNLLQLHYKKLHPDYYGEHKKVDNRKCAKLKCPICGKMFSDIKQHVNRTHRMDWEYFCNTYNWDKSLTKNVTEEYKKHLSDNKINFYHTTHRGKELRQLQSLRYKEDNPSKNRKIIEKVIFNRTIGKGIPTINYRGVKVEYDNCTFRSLNEYIFYVLCKHNNIKIEYEPKKYVVKYYNSDKYFITTYLPDFIVENKYLIELKSTEREINASIKLEKYKKVSNIYKAKCIDFNITYPVKFLSEYFDIKYENYEVSDIIKEYTKKAIENENIHFTCKENSRTVKFLTGYKKLENNKIITIYEFHKDR